ncbi:MAG: hypothetical protein JRH20_00835 [Deltaproteobacteria bacterium]|nr:hypothetical protein [Deltaproteobacteria bacterium]
MRKPSFWILSFVLISAIPKTSAASQQSWVVLPVRAIGVEASTAETLRELLASGLRQQLNAKLVGGALTPCADMPCARAAGQRVGAQFVLMSSASRLGKKTIVMATVIDVVRGVQTSNQRMSVERVEELDTVATRVISAIAQGTSADKTAQLGSITSSEERPDRRRKTTHSAALRIGGIAPVGAGYANSVGGGMAFDLSYFFEARHFAIEPRIGIRFDAIRGSEGYLAIPMDIGFYYILGLGDVAPFIGGGVGAHFLWDERQLDTQLGSTLPATATKLSSQTAWGFGAFARLGIIFMRTYDVRLAATVDYEITFTTINGAENPQAIIGGLAVIL